MHCKLPLHEARGNTTLPPCHIGPCLVTFRMVIMRAKSTGTLQGHHRMRCYALLLLEGRQIAKSCI